ncbi:MAG: glycosyltransferase family 2 protein, partial [Selenomonadaceae bacterium]
MKKTAVLILTYNEEKNIADCIKSAAFADEVVVVDSASTDKTCEIAKQLGAKVCIHPMNGFAEQRNFALEQTEADWVFYLDADERLTPQAAEEIQRLTTEEPSAYEIKRINIIFGQMMRHGEHAPDYSLRLYPRQAIRWEGKIHEQAIV